MTPNYKTKTDNLGGGVGYEYSIISAEIFNNGIDTDKFIPLLRIGEKDTAIPVNLQGRLFVDMRVDSEFNQKFEELLRDIFNEPVYKKPEIGVRPKFDNE